MIAFLDLIHSPFIWLVTLPKTIGILLLGILVCAAITLSGFVLARLRIAPFWSLLLLVPYANIISIWMVAYSKKWIHKEG